METAHKEAFNDFYKELEESLAPVVEETNIRILIFGPDLDSAKESAKLRKYLIRKCRETGHIVVLAEHEDIKEFYEKLTSSENDYCKIEHHLATEKHKGKDIIDGIVIIPDSESSFIELGMFAIEDYYHYKFLVLINQDFKTSMESSFVGLGAKSAFDNGDAKTKFISYKSRKIVFNEVQHFIGKIRNKKIWKSLRKHHEPSI